MSGRQSPLPPERQDQAKIPNNNRTPVAPSFFDKIGNWEESSLTMLKIWYRICFAFISGFGVCVLFMLVWFPDRVVTIVELFEFGLSSGRGITLPLILLSVISFKLLEKLLVWRKISEE